MQSQKWQTISVHFQGKPFNITVIQVYAPNSNGEEAEVEWVYEDLQDLLELTPQKDALFIIGDWNAKVGSQEIPGVTGKFGLGVQNEAGQSNIASIMNRVLHRNLYLELWELNQLLKRSPRLGRGSLKAEIWFFTWVIKCYIHRQMLIFLCENAAFSLNHDRCREYWEPCSFVISVFSS